MIKLRHLSHGGIMPNYQCTAACRHCLYACSMDWEGYMTEADMETACENLRYGGCRSVHIGGGEPFMNFDGLVALVKMAVRYGISVEYVETNGYWATDEKTVKNYLEALRDAGADTLCISVDPFHAEYVPYERPVRLAELCRRYRFGYFLWQERFLSMLTGVAPDRAHVRRALEENISSDYIYKTARVYGLRYGGRAINIESEYGQKKPLEKLLTTNSPCRELLSTNHFHVDMYGRFIPPGCTGIAIPLREMVDGIDPGKYPAFEALASGGVTALVDYAKERGFQPEPGYTSTCALCFHTRHWLSKLEGTPELVREHYEQSLAHYD